MSKANNAATVKVAVSEVTSEIMLESWTDTSKKIRGLSSMGYTVGEIEKILKKVGVTTKQGDAIRYQHVRNVLNTVIKG